MTAYLEPVRVELERLRDANEALTQELALARDTLEHRTAALSRVVAENETLRRAAT